MTNQALINLLNAYPQEEAVDLRTVVDAAGWDASYLHDALTALAGHNELAGRALEPEVQQVLNALDAML